MSSSIPVDSTTDSGTAGATGQQSPQSLVDVPARGTLYDELANENMQLQLASNRELKSTIEGLAAQMGALGNLMSSLNDTIASLRAPQSPQVVSPTPARGYSPNVPIPAQRGEFGAVGPQYYPDAAQQATGYRQSAAQMTSAERAFPPHLAATDRTPAARQPRVSGRTTMTPEEYYASIGLPATPARAGLGVNLAATPGTYSHGGAGPTPRAEHGYTSESPSNPENPRPAPQVETATEQVHGQVDSAADTNQAGQEQKDNVPKQTMPKFTDSRLGVENFCVLAEVWRSSQRISSDRTLIESVGLALTGRAADWFLAKCEADPTRSHPLFNSWELFKSRLKAVYGNVDPQAQAYAELVGLRQDKMTDCSASEYVEKFHGLYLRANITQEMHAITLFKAGLMKNFLTPFDRSPPKTISEWFKEVEQLDRTREDNKLLQQASRRSDPSEAAVKNTTTPKGRSAGRVGIGTATLSAGATGSKPASNSTAPRHNPQFAKQGRSRDDALEKELAEARQQRKQWRKEGKCLNCGSSEHFVANCPTPKHGKLVAVLELLEELEEDGDDSEVAEEVEEDSDQEENASQEEH